jgi:hypothetical protein
MSNSNGLLSSKDVSATGDPDSVFFLRNGVPIAVPSPFQVDSPAGNSVLTISESNTNVATIENLGDVVINTLASGGDVVVNADELEIHPRTNNFNSGSVLTMFNRGATVNAYSAYYKMYVPGANGGGLEKDHFQLFAYPSTGGTSEAINIDTDGNVFLPQDTILNNANVTGSLTIDNKPVAKASKVAWVGLGGANNDTITIPINTSAQNVSANFAVVAGHTYRVTAQFRLECGDDSDINAIMYVNITTEPNASIESIGMAGVRSAGTTGGVLDNTTCYSALFVPTASVATCRLIAGNTSLTDSGALKISSVGQPQDSPNILLEDLGVL